MSAVPPTSTTPMRPETDLNDLAQLYRATLPHHRTSHQQENLFTQPGCLVLKQLD